MAHNDTVRAQPWSAEMVPTAADWQRLDVQQAAALNGDDGGTWAPATPIVFAGSAGAWASTSTSTSLQGGVSTSLGGRLVLGDSDYPEFAVSPATRNVFVPCRHARYPSVGLPSFGSPNAILLGGATIGSPNSAVVSMRGMHHNATLSTAYLYASFAPRLAVASYTPPSWGVFAIDLTTPGAQAELALNSTSSTTSFVTPSVSDAYSSVKSAQFVTNNSLNLIDRTRYAYYARIFDESGGDAVPGNIFYGVLLVFTGINDLRPE